VRRKAAQPNHARDGFHAGVVTGMIGMALAGATSGNCVALVKPRKAGEHTPSLAEYYDGRIFDFRIENIRMECAAKNISTTTS